MIPQAGQAQNVLQSVALHRQTSKKVEEGKSTIAVIFSERYLLVSGSSKYERGRVLFATVEIEGFLGVQKVTFQNLHISTQFQ